MWNHVKLRIPAITYWFPKQCLLGFFILEKHHGVNPVWNDCMNLQPYNHDSFSKILRASFASRNWWIIIVFLQRTLKEKLPFVLINTLLLHIPLLALSDRQTELQTEEQIHSLHVGWRNFISSCAVVSVFWLWREIVLGVTYLPYQLCHVSFFCCGRK